MDSITSATEPQNHLISGAHLDESQKLADGQLTGSRSKVANFYNQRSVLITGASGFVGKVLIEKLLRSCPNIGRIFVLIRPKWNKSPEERLHELLKAPLFDKVRELSETHNHLKLEDRVVVVEGDCMKANLGISEDNVQRIIDEVSVIFHSAATVKFDEPLKQSVGINIAGTKNIVELSKKIPKLAALVHVSTAYANCEHSEIDEHIYPTEMDPENLIELASWLDQDTLQELKEKLLGPKPNTYTYTKALAEWLLVKIARNLPLAICRPSIVVASWKEPFSGWIDNFNGPTGIILGAGKGLIRSMYAEKAFRADLIPVDTVINMIISLGWFANVYHSHKQLTSSENMSESLVESASSGMFSSAGEEDDSHSPSMDYLDGLNETKPQINRRLDDHQESGNTIYDNLDANDSNNNDSNENNQNQYDRHSPEIVDYRLVGDNSKQRQQDLFQKRLNMNNMHADDGYGSASRSPDADSMTSSASDYATTITKNNNDNKQSVKQQQGNHITNREVASNGLFNHHMSHEVQTRLAEQREFWQIERRLKKFRRNTQLKLKAKGMPEYLAEVPVFHCTSGETKPITWGQIQVLVMSFLVKFPSISTYRYPCGSFTNSAKLDSFYRITLHYIPGYLVDFITRLLGGKPALVKIFRKFDQAANVLKAFTRREWKFEYKNGPMLINELMSDADRDLFNFDLEGLNWADFTHDYTLGVRKYLLNEPLSSLEQARTNLRRTYYRNLTLQILFFALIGFYFFKA